MAASLPSVSSMQGPSNFGARDRVAEALYNWCRENHEDGHLFNQADLLSAGVLPDRDLGILLTAATYLVQKNLFKIHDVRAGGGIGWELVSPERAANYAGLTRDEHLVYSCIDSAKSAGIWTRTIKNRVQAHAKVLERVYKSLEGRSLIKPMKSVKNPQRKMFIAADLEPSEEATGGAWFTEGQLDVGLMDTISGVIEHYVSKKSWREGKLVENTENPENPVDSKQKAPHDGFDSQGKGKSKAAKIDDHQPRSVSPEIRNQKPKPRSTNQRTYEPFDAGHDKYPTLREITKEVLRTRITPTALPENAIGQLLEVMVYDDRLFKMHRPAQEDEPPDNVEDQTITMYRCFKTPTALVQRHHFAKRKASENPTIRKSALRQQEIENIGRGGSSEVPCMQCPVFDLCGDGGPVNVVTCRYFDEWYQKLADADRDAGNPWPGHVEVGEKPVPETKPPPQPESAGDADVDPDAMEIT